MNRRIIKILIIVETKISILYDYQDGIHNLLKVIIS